MFPLYSLHILYFGLKEFVHVNFDMLELEKKDRGKIGIQKKKLNSRILGITKKKVEIVWMTLTNLLIKIKPMCCVYFNLIYSVVINVFFPLVYPFKSHFPSFFFFFFTYNSFDRWNVNNSSDKIILYDFRWTLFFFFGDV